MPDRAHNVSGLTVSQLERARRDLEVSLALAWPGSPVRVSIAAEMAAIDTELANHAERGGQRHGPSGLVRIRNR
jgi:hypothetical protein